MVRATATTERKEYVDRGVQTDLVRRLSQDSTKPVNSRVYDSPVPVTPPKSTLFDQSTATDAYSGSTGHAVGPTRSPPTSRKHSQLPYSRPSHIQSLTQRVFSLPETSPAHSTRVPPEIRTVSLSELPRASLSFSDNTNESSTSPDTSFLSDNRSGSSRPRCSFPSSDVPHTPSPPSSPESVMIIGNDKQVPISFLRQKAKAAYEDDNGDWISWASSPPKPIPALHGPLSLPYARCPSGAEGTIIEGEDLSRMIWGLGIEDGGTQSTHSRANSIHKPTPKTTFTPRLQYDASQIPTALPRHQPQVSQDPHHAPGPNNPDAVQRHVKNQFLDQRALESLGPRHSFRSQIQDRSLHVPQLPDPWSEGHDDLIQDQLYAYDGQGGLGFDWQENLRRQLSSSTTEASKPKSQNTLKPSAPVFVPASQQATQQFPRIFVEPRIPHTINAPRRLTAIEIAQQYQQRAQNSLPTPPGSSSPQWTSHLQTYTDPFPPLDLHALLPAKPRPNLGQQPLVHELQQFPADRSQLRHFVFDRMQNPSMGLNESVLQNQPYMSSPAIQYRRAAIEMSPPPPGPPPNSPLPPLPSSRGRSRNFLTPSSPTAPETSVLHRNASKLRSVPFARLLQRRLSSVPEEESGHYMEPYSPPPSPPRTSTTLRLPRPPSHTLADSFQSRSQTSRRHVMMRTPSPGPDNGFGLRMPTPGAFDSDTTRRGAARSKAFVKQPFAMANLDAGSDNRGEGSTKTDGSTGESGWEKENGKPKKKARSKKAKVGGVSDDMVSPWLAASQAPEAWL